MNKIAIIGGGIAGLSTAYYLQMFARSRIGITVIESTEHWGGQIISTHEQGFLIEGGPDSFMTHKGAAFDLCCRLGLENQLLRVKHGKHAPYVWRGGRLYPLPTGLMLTTPTKILPFLRSQLISWPGKLRVLAEMLIPRGGQEDESLARFVRRRFGAEILEKIATPLLAGIYSSDPETLSMQSIFPHLLEMEARYGSLLRGAMAQKRLRARAGSRQNSPDEPVFTAITPRQGLQQLVDAIRAQINPKGLLTGHRAVAVTKEGSRYHVELDNGSGISADEVVLATPAYITADLIEGIDPVLAEELRTIRYASTVNVSLGFRRSDIRRPLPGTGFLVTRSSKRKITACSWASVKFEHRAPEDCVLVRAFLGGAHAERLVELDEEELMDLARQELYATTGITATPLLMKAYRWQAARPQYEVGHRQRLREIFRRLGSHPGLSLVGAAYRGSSIPDCIEGGESAARAIAKRLEDKGIPINDVDRRSTARQQLPVIDRGKPMNRSVVAPAESFDCAMRDYARNPLLIYWETTQACALACRHCRAEAMPFPSPDELSGAEGKDLLRQIAAFGKPLPHLILTGGDPMRRSGLYGLIRAARALGLTVSITPSATSELTFVKLLELKTAGIGSLGLSLDGSSASRHDAIRGVSGCFDRTMQTLKQAETLALPVQVNTLVSEETIGDLPAVYELLKTFQVKRWGIFFLVAVGRGKALRPISPERGEELMHWIYDLTKSAPFEIKTTEAPSYRRVALARMRAEGLPATEIKKTSVYRGFKIRDGHGILFISHRGDIYPSGFLPLTAGNTRRDHVVEVYRDSPLFRALHNSDQLEGKCGRCEYRVICGGSRARAYEATHNILASDPFCPYQPKTSRPGALAS